MDTYSAATDPYPYSGTDFDCGLDMSLASSQYFSDLANQSFECSDVFANGDSNTGGIKVDGQQAYSSWDNASSQIAVSVTQDPTNGDITIHESEPLSECTNLGEYGYCLAYASDGVTDQRTIQQAGDGRVVLITDDFVSTDGAPHRVDFSVSSTFDEGVNEQYPSGTDYFQLPGQSGYSAPNAGDSTEVGSGLPGTIYSYNDTYSDGSDAGYDALTYFTAPSGPVSFADNYYYYTTPVSTATIPFTVNVPAGGSQSLSLAYASEYSQSALAGDLQTEQDLQSAPTVTISSPAAGANVPSAGVTVTGSVSAFTGVKTVSVNGVAATVSGGSFSAAVPLTPGSNAITAVVTTNSGITASATETVIYAPAAPGTPITPAVQGSATATWLPIADTGSARHVSAHREKLLGSVTPGSGGVSYYFQYGTRGHLNHRSKTVALVAGKSSRHVALTIGGLSHGTRYMYRLVATGTYGNATGSSRSFKTTARHK